MKKFTVRLAVLFLVTATISAWAGESSLNMRVIWSGDARTQAVIIWDTEQEQVNAVLRVGTRSGKYDRDVAVSEEGLYDEGGGSASEKSKKAKKPKKPKKPNISLFFHQVPLNNLKAGATYYFSVKTPKGVSREYHFTSAPDDNRPFKLLFAGDSRTHIEIARQMSSQFKTMVKEDPSIRALLHGGDYANSPKRALWKEWLAAYNLTTSEDGKLLPIIPVVGNHEAIKKSPLYGQAYGFPGEGKYYFTTKLSPEVAIVCLNTEISAEGNQKSFLKNELSKLRADKIKWQLTAYHRPIYAAVKKPSKGKVSWVPLFEEFNIDLALESDGHCIKRTVPIRGGKEAADGIVYLGEGGYGAPQRTPKADRWFTQGDNSFTSQGDHVMILEFTDSEIHYSAVLLNGDIVDTQSFKSRR